jgi:ATP-binding cassette, subfamily B, bacterial CvaB/MchF/RaxB
VNSSSSSVLNLNLFGTKLRPILQTEAAECGVACLAMVATHFGLRTDLAALRARFSVSMKGATLAQLMGYAAALELSARPLRLELEELPQLAVPCVLHWDMNHFVVLVKASAKSITILDPAMGERTLPISEVSGHFTGVALELSPTPAFVKRDERQKIKLWPLMGSVMGLKRSLAVVMVLAIALQVFTVISPLFMQWIVDGVLVSADRDLLTIIGFGSLILLLTQLAISTARSWSLLYVSTTLGLQWTGRVFSHMMRLPVSFFEKRHLGDVVSRFDSVKAIQRSLTTSILEAILDGVMAIVTLGMMALYSVKLCMIVFVALSLYGLMRWASYGMLKQASGDLLALNAKASSHFLESIRAVRPIKLFGGEEDRKARWQNMTIDGINRNVQVERLNLVFKTANALIFGIEGVAILWLGANSVMSRELSIGMLMAFISYKDQFNGRISSLIDKFIEYKMLDLHAERLADIVLTKAEPLSAPEVPSNKKAAQTAVPKIELRGVCFRYADAEPWVLRDINITFEPCDNAVIAGASGCGKSTLVKIILGLLPPTEGDVLVDGVPVSRLGFAAYRKLVSTVMQDDVLLAGSVADNITFFDVQPNLLRMEVASKVASIHDEIAAMPMQYRTLVGDMGTTLSGGQKQRVLLARALYHQPKVLVLDEATSHLDGDNEAKVNGAIRNLKLTRISVAHRKETIAMADRMIVLANGQVVRDERRPGSGPPEISQRRA